VLLPVPGDRDRPQLAGLPSVGSRHAGNPSAPRQRFGPWCADLRRGAL